MRTAEVQFSEIKLIWSAKYFMDGGTVDVDRWDGGRCFWNTPLWMGPLSTAELNISQRHCKLLLQCIV